MGPADGSQPPSIDCSTEARASVPGRPSYPGARDSRRVGHIRDGTPIDGTAQLPDVLLQYSEAFHTITERLPITVHTSARTTMTARYVHHLVVVSFELKHRTRIAHQLVKIVRRELRDSARALTTNDDSPFEDVVHESRKSVKKVRAVTTLLDAAGAKLPRKDRKRLKAAARSLSRLRDSGAIIEAFDRVRRRYSKQVPGHTYQILRRGPVGARDREEAPAQREGGVSEAADRLAATRKSAGAWVMPSIDVSRLLAVIAVSYVRARRAMRGARETEYSATLHRWRKAVKTLWYQLRLAQPLTTGLAPLI